MFSPDEIRAAFAWFQLAFGLAVLIWGLRGNAYNGDSVAARLATRYFAPMGMWFVLSALFRLLEAECNAHMKLTESYAMWPPAAVSGFYLSHPDAAYFAVGKIGRDQVEDYARRSGLSLAEAEKWLAPNLAYELESAPL